MMKAPTEVVTGGLDDFRATGSPGGGFSQPLAAKRLRSGWHAAHKVSFAASVAS
jgi:hypothetical protein